jgi:hypothetical protein
VHPEVADTVEKLRREVEPRRGRSDGAVLPGVDGLIAVFVRAES